MKLKCPKCNKEYESKNIVRGCYQFWCVVCKIPFESHIVDIDDMTKSDQEDYLD